MVILRAIGQAMERLLGSRIFAVLATVAAALVRAAWDGSTLSAALAAASPLLVSTVAVLLYALARRAIFSKCADAARAHARRARRSEPRVLRWRINVWRRV